MLIKYFPLQNPFSEHVTFGKKQPAKAALNSFCGLSLFEESPCYLAAAGLSAINFSASVS
jgi:hypothetical protein